ncbi:hypothetical protein [Hymenobacter sp. 102]|uniref:hypothetical protein n=1 Tax=Hymenobacter sp. 102 TaxID=3403152 RepID=UPI003CEDF26B
MLSTNIYCYLLCCIVVYVASLLPAKACQCKELKKLGKVELVNAESVFIGRVVSIDSTDNWHKIIVFEVLDNLKKDGRKKISVSTGYGMGDCGLPIKTEQEWYIFTQIIEGKASATICGRSILLNDSIASLGNRYGYDDFMLEKHSDNIARVAAEIKYIRKKYLTRTP